MEEGLSRMLVVSGEEALRILYSDEFLEEGYEVTAICAGDQVIGLIKKTRPDLVFLDIRSDQTDGRPEGVYGFKKHWTRPHCEAIRQKLERFRNLREKGCARPQRRGLMKIRTNPTPRRGKRNIFCPFYSDCLSEVIRKQWSRWNCAKCEQQTNREAEPEIPLNINYSVAYYEVNTKIS
jgi:hypothetical protein